jgi:hypothetical protein
VATIEATLAEQGQQQQLMSVGLLHAERAPCNQGDDKDDEGFPTAQKMEFPKYDGVGDPLPWLNRCKHYFHVQRTPENRHVMYSSFYLTDDTQLWYHRLELNTGPPPRPCFIQLVNKRFGPPLTDSLIGEIALLRHDGNFDDFAQCFMALLYRDTTITEAHQV